MYKVTGPGEGIVRLVDWEMVGLGSGAQDLGQYMISHVKPAVRREIEGECLSSYYETLTSDPTGKVTRDNYSFEECKKDYAMGGAGRWMWMLCLLSAMCPDAMVQYFHDQVLAFLMANNITEENICMPSV